MSSYKPYKRGYLTVTDGHKLYYELCGNPNGKPVLYLHGGPGSGFSTSSKRFFDPSIWNILLLDQRGSGKSLPFASLHENNTWKLVEDIRSFLNFCGLSKVFLFGGSWGSTLALVYAITYPKSVEGMLLRGIFLGTEEEMQYFLGDGVGDHYPEHLNRLLKLVPKQKQRRVKDIENYYMSKVMSKDEKVREPYSYEWSRYETALLKLETGTETEIEKNLKTHSYQSAALIELHYFVHDCFLTPGFILKNAHKLLAIPTTIVQGRYDLICPPSSAYKLHQAMKNSKLIFTTAGHTSSEKETRKILKEEMVKYSKTS